MDVTNFYINDLDQIPSMIWKINADLKCEYVNKVWVDFTGISMKQALENGLAEVIHPDDLDTCKKNINEASIKKETFQTEARLRRKDGEYRSCLFAGAPYYNLDGLYSGYIGSIIDITESKKAIESFNRYQNLAEITDEIILFLDLDGRIVDANKAAVKAYGYTYEELCSLNIRNIRTDWHYTKEQMDIANKEGIFFEAIHRRKDGSCFYVEVSSRGTTMDKKRILTSIVRDITERKTAVSKIREQEELFRTVFDQAPIGIIFGNNDKHILRVNPKFEEITGRSKEELSALSWTDYTHPDDIEKDLNQFKKFRAGEINGYSIVKRYIRPDGSLIWVNFTLARMKIGDHSDSAHICMIENITERIQAENDMQESERSKAVLLSNLPGMAYRCKYDKDWTMQFVSDGCYDLTGYKAESLLQNKELSFNDLIDPDYKEYLWEKWAHLLPNKGVLKEEYTITTAAGDVKWVYEQGRGIYDDTGNVVALEGLIIDITDRKKKEEEILYLNYHDVLTGLYNRRFFDEQIKVLDKESLLPISIIVGDINGLKLINDALGHSQGDELIVAISKILFDCVAGSGIVTRTGGDDFSIILPKTTNDEANKIMKQIETASSEYISKSKGVIYQTNISLGCATKSNEKDTLGSVVKSAEDSMYRNKLLQNKSMHSSVISSMKTTLLEKSQETEEHALRLIELSKAIGQKMMLTNEQLNELELLSTLHDIGKIGISDSIINKPGKLTAEERNLMNKHPEIGYRIAMTSKELLPIAEYILCHHERYDGKGYPQGLKGNEIPLLSRIIAVADAYDAMTEDRPYRKAMTKEAAISEIRRNAGTQFDPEIAKIFIDVISGMSF